MPYKKSYSSKTVGTMKSSKVNGNQGKGVSIKPMYNKSKATKRTKFPG